MRVAFVCLRFQSINLFVAILNNILCDVNSDSRFKYLHTLLYQRSCYCIIILRAFLHVYLVNLTNDRYHTRVTSPFPFLNFTENFNFKINDFSTALPLFSDTFGCASSRLREKSIFKYLRYALAHWFVGIRHIVNRPNAHIIWSVRMQPIYQE